MSDIRGGRPTFGTCENCGLPVEGRRAIDEDQVLLQPGEFPAHRIPEQARWHLANGIAWPGNDTAWCRLDHAEVCPAGPEPEHRALRELHRRLALRARIAQDRRSR
ncbi:DUF6083 domain-containing protein [Streptomyces sp. NPDC058157]|uniref:DUF6083 domain-containing protein n=1 Tax=Streptomyces sp. NPDC058157 TaxID=3346360 RepID=UPI0036E0250B